MREKGSQGDSVLWQCGFGMSRLWRVALSLLAVMTLALAGPACLKDEASEAAVTEVSSQQAYNLILREGGSADFVILDVRTPGEFAEGHIKSAINVDVQSVSFRSEVSKLSPNNTYLVYCRTGNRSRQAVTIMREFGFSSIYHLTRGITEWTSENLPVVK
jgi:rhodanese-related sulfurtransferase